MAKVARMTNMSSGPVDVSIIIPTLGRNRELLEQCLNSLTKLNFPGQFDVWVIFNCVKPAEKLPRLPKLNLHQVYLGHNRGFAGAVNKGIRQSSGQLVVLLNDDTTVQPDWLTKLTDKQANTGAAMVASTVYLADKTTLDSQGFTFAWRGKAEALTSTSSSLTKMPDYWLNNPDLLPVTDTISAYWQEPFGPDAAACLYTRDLLNEIGLLREDFFAYLEDVELSLRARQAGYYCSLAEYAIVYHHKHATSATMSGFKAKQDMVNWWKVVRTYPRGAFKFWPKILVERLRNLSGFVKTR